MRWATMAWRRIPPVTLALMVLCGLVFLYQAGLPPEEREQLVLVWGAIPLEITEQDLPPATPVSTWLTLLSALFLHLDPLHLINNLFLLAIFGPALERELGWWRFLALYLLTGVGAGLAQVVVYPASLFPIVGASGAIAGVMAGSLVLFPRLGARAVVFAIWLVREVAFGLRLPHPIEQWVGGAATWAHFGGLVLGGLLAFLLKTVGKA